MDKVIQNFEKVLIKFPGLADVLTKLEAAHIRYGLYGGGYVALLTSNREINDLDFLVADDDMIRLKKLFPAAKTKNQGKYGPCSFLIIGDGEEFEFVSDVHINIEQSHYRIILSAACLSHSSAIHHNGIKLRLLNKVDTIIFKAILQRGSEAGKHDLEDIAAILQPGEIDKEYLQFRLRETKADNRLLKALAPFQLI